jgi:hypothetical protein
MKILFDMDYISSFDNIIAFIQLINDYKTKKILKLLLHEINLI